MQQVAPKSGLVAGGNRVVIKGKGFTDATAVNFGTVAATSFKVLNQHVIAAVAPVGTLGQTVDITVTTPLGTSAVVTGDHYTYRDKATKPALALAVRYIAPRGGPAAGGARVVIIGDGFLGATGVTFGTVAATSFKVLNAHVIMAISPAGTADQTVDITVTTAAGTSPVVQSARYTYRVAKTKGH